MRLAMTSFTSRYGNPGVDFGSARVWAQSRHAATVVAVSGRLDAANVARVSDYAIRLISAGEPFVLDLSRVTVCSARVLTLLDAIDGRCLQSGTQWALVSGDAVARRSAGRADEAAFPVVASVAEAEHCFDDVIADRRRFLLPLLRKSA
jgi:anti-anti-sigma regulatory factor